MSHCTCISPPVYDLTDACCSKQTKIASSSTNASHHQRLGAILKQYGFCKLQINPSQLAEDSPLRCLQPPEHSLKLAIHNLFEKDNDTIIQQVVSSSSSSSSSLVYRGRTAESGAATSLQAEPKQSWEVKRCCCCSHHDNDVEKKLHGWCEALHAVAVAVTRELQLPPNLLLREDPCCCGGCRAEEERCNVDLMRVFLYDSVENSDDKRLGSSPHSDWGSWTVVWQDEVGGLQTFCQAHQRWNDVDPPSNNDSLLLYFVVHLSDVTSLAMGHAMMMKATDHQQQQQQQPAAWPSPVHRVVCPTDGRPRASLVYFAYPPPGITLQDMEEALRPCMEKDEVWIPYEQYYVLKNQASSSTQEADSNDAGKAVMPKEVYERIRCRPLHEVFSEKWKQVQRS